MPPLHRGTCLLGIATRGTSIARKPSKVSNDVLTIRQDQSLVLNVGNKWSDSSAMTFASGYRNLNSRSLMQFLAARSR